MTPPIETGDPNVQIDGFRHSLSEFSTGVTVITTSVNGERFGLTSNSFASVSLAPPLILSRHMRLGRTLPAQPQHSSGGSPCSPGSSSDDLASGEKSCSSVKVAAGPRNHLNLCPTRRHG